MTDNKKSINKTEKNKKYFAIKIEILRTNIT